jgi:hypothetical protein
MCAYGWRHSSFYILDAGHTPHRYELEIRGCHICAGGRRDQESFVYREVRKDFGDGKRCTPVDGKWWPNNWNERPHFGPFSCLFSRHFNLYVFTCCSVKVVRLRRCLRRANDSSWSSDEYGYGESVFQRVGKSKIRVIIGIEFRVVSSAPRNSQKDGRSVWETLAELKPFGPCSNWVVSLQWYVRISLRENKRDWAAGIGYNFLGKFTTPAGMLEP